jgi:hypothetical protein
MFGLFKPKVIIKEVEVIKEVIKELPWIDLKDEKPPHEVVLGACDTYDCGWVLETVWWDDDKRCWMKDSKQAHLNYSHWQRLPSKPDFIHNNY